MTLDEFVGYMRSAIDAYHTKESALKPGDEEYVEEAGLADWLEWFNYFVDSRYDG